MGTVEVQIVRVGDLLRWETGRLDKVDRVWGAQVRLLARGDENDAYWFSVETVNSLLNSGRLTRHDTTQPANSMGRLVARLIDEYAGMTGRSANRPYAQGFGYAIVVAGMLAWDVDEEEAAERIDEMITDARIARGDG